MVRKSKKDWIAILTLIIVFITLIYTILSFYSNKQGMDKQIDYANKTLEEMKTHQSNMDVRVIPSFIIIILVIIIIYYYTTRYKSQKFK